MNIICRLSEGTTWTNMNQQPPPPSRNFFASGSGSCFVCCGANISQRLANGRLVTHGESRKIQLWHLDAKFWLIISQNLSLVTNQELILCPQTTSASAFFVAVRRWRNLLSTSDTLSKRGSKLSDGPHAMKSLSARVPERWRPGGAERAKRSRTGEATPRLRAEVTPGRRPTDPPVTCATWEAL